LAISISRSAKSLTAWPVRLGLVVVVVISALVLAAGVVSRSSLLDVRTIDVTGASRLTTARVIARAHIDGSTNALWLDEEAVERRLERHPWISEAYVSVALPSTVGISIVERTPVAVATNRFGELYIAADGTSLGRANGDVGLPLIESADREVAAAALAAMPVDVRSAVESVEYEDDGSLEVRVRLHDGVTVAYGPADRLVAKGLVVERILAWAEESREQLDSVDVTAPGSPAVALG
jgi:cell division protein FtsQ